MHRVRLAGLDLAAAATKMHDIIAPWTKETAIISFEQPPPTARKDMRHGHQAPIGWKLGLISGIVISPFLSNPDIVIQEVKVADWRRKMLELAAVQGQPLTKPSRRSIANKKVDETGPQLQSPLITVPGGGWIGQYSCGHQLPLPDLRAVQSAPQTCPTCSKDKREKSAAGTEIRELWKKTACQFVGRLFPANYNALVVEARHSARTKQPDHKLSGVADASEGTCIALTAISDQILNGKHL
jgi:hypothetical protein